MIWVLLSIAVLATLAWFVNKLDFGVTLCPICVGVSTTWVALILGYFLGYEVNLVIPAILMGGSIVGITYTLYPKINHPLWKPAFIILGFGAVYALLYSQWFALIISLVAMTGVYYLLRPSGKVTKDRGRLERIKDRLRECC